MVFQISGNLIRFSNYKREVAVEADTVHRGLEALAVSYPQLRPVLLDGNGQVRKIIRLFVDGEQMAPGEIHLPVPDNTTVSILTPIAGG